MRNFAEAIPKNSAEMETVVVKETGKPVLLLCLFFLHNPLTA